MAVPKRKMSKSRVARRRAQHDVIRVPPAVIACAKCKEPTLPHRVCPACGHYDGELIVAKKKSGEAAEA